MDPSNRVSLVLEGLPSEQGHVRLDDFIRELQIFTGILRKTESDLNPRAERSTYFRVVDLRHSSPATVVVEARPLDPQVDNRAVVLSTFFGALSGVMGEAPLPPTTSEAWLQDLRRLADPVGRSLSTLRIENGKGSVTIDPAFQERVTQLLAPEETFPGAIRGMLEAINLHASANLFRIYPDVGPPKLTCRFSSDLEATAVSALGRFVEARGVLHYKRYAAFPHELRVTGMEVFPDEKDLPTLRSMRGLAPAATGDLSSEAFVRSLRDAS